MNQAIASFEPVYSAYGHDPDLADLVAVFAKEIPDRVACFRPYLDGPDWEGLGRVTHQLKGAAGSYGFDQLTPILQRFESLVKQRASLDALEVAFHEVVAVCERVRPGGPE